MRGIDSFPSPGRLPKRNVSPRCTEGKRRACAFPPGVYAYVTARRSSPFPRDRSRTLKIFTSPETERVSSVEGTERRRPANGRLAERVSGPGG